MRERHEAGDERRGFGRTTRQVPVGDLTDRYYALRDWNVSNGRQGRVKLEQLGMGDVADTLASAGRLDWGTVPEVQPRSASPDYSPAFEAKGSR